MSTRINETWIEKKWRPAMAWQYMVVCCFDFVIFPIAWAVLQAYTKQELTQWMPITLQGAGLYHMAMGAVLGVAAWSRGQEKVAIIQNGHGRHGSTIISAEKDNMESEPR